MKNLTQLVVASILLSTPALAQSVGDPFEQGGEVFADCTWKKAVNSNALTRVGDCPSAPQSDRDAELEAEAEAKAKAGSDYE